MQTPEADFGHVQQQDVVLDIIQNQMSSAPNVLLNVSGKTFGMQSIETDFGHVQ